MNGIEKPRFRVGPVALGCSLGDADDVCSLFECEAGEKAQFYQIRLLLIFRGKLIEGVVDGQQFVFILGGHRDFDLSHIHAFLSASVAQREFAPRALDQNASHRLGGGAEEMGAILKFGSIAQSEPGFMDKRGRLQGLPRTLARHFRPGEFAQFGIYQWE